MAREKNVLTVSAATTADFDHPVEMLAACHERIEDRCALLHRLLNQLERAGCDETAVARLTDLQQRHIALEEGELLPLAERVPDARGYLALGAARAARRGVRR